MWLLEKLGKKLEVCLKLIGRGKPFNVCLICEMENLSVDVKHFVHCLFIYFHEVK
jgi:hypothetical protein